MGNLKSRRRPKDHESQFYAAQQLTGTGLSYDKSTKVIYTENSDEVVIGTRCGLTLFPMKQPMDLMKRLGLVIKTKGGPFSRHSTLVVADYYRVQGDKFVPKSKLANDQGLMGPAERSGALRVGDSLYALNGILIVNKSKGHIQRQLNDMIQHQSFPIELTWRHDTTVNQIAWEIEPVFPAPEGDFYQRNDEFGTGNRQKYPSVAI